ncbi:MAG: EboA family metabolite traffic protein [Cyanobacteria bacterium]|jgi:hypothetical protein|nr:EboA family metabolite traffic protein [Cyanobacteria bacterium GSL.Bin1]
MVKNLDRSITLPRIRQISNELQNWLSHQIEPTAWNWLVQSIQQLQEKGSEVTLFTKFSAASRYLGKLDLHLTPNDLSKAHALRSGWTPKNWSVDQAARTLLLLSFSSENADRYEKAIEKLFSAADVAEQVALYQSLPLLPYPTRFKARAIEGLRSNMTVVFNAIALNNPYPADYFEEDPWNQMVLKALFIDSQLSQMQGLETRANPKLAQMLSDYAHERWAAGRQVNPQLWRPFGFFAQGNLLLDLERVLKEGQPYEQEAAALACASASTPEAKALLNSVPQLKQQIANQSLTWESFSKTYP